MPRRQPVAPKYFEYEYTRIVLRGQIANSDTKSSAKVRVDVVGQDDEVGPFGGDDLGDLAQPRRIDFHRWRIAGIDHEERLHGGVSEFVEFGI